MSQNVCNICGANYEYHNGRWKCPACGAFKAEELSNEEVTLLYNAAQKLRLSDFDEAEKAYADIIEKFPKNPDGYWGRLLSRYGIKYEEDFDGRKIPTCYATSIESVITDKDYLKAIELADQETKAYYTLQAEYIERVRKEWVEKARKEKPYDIFICYKDSDLANGIDRTQDSIAAQELYIHLRDQGYRVFFSRESLRGKVGEKYEPYIFNALSTAKVMLVYGSKSEYITSTWLKNEWTRYEKRLQAGEKKPNSLIVACDGFSPTELPKVLSSMQCFDATSRSFYTDLDAVLKKIIKGEEKPKPVVEPKPEKKKSKKLPIAIASIAALIAIFLCILLPNVLGDKPFATVTDSKYGVVISADSEIFDKNTSVIVDKLTDGAQYTSLVSVVNTTKTIDIQNAIIYDIECDVDITKSVTIKVAYTKSDADSTVKVYYVSDDKTTIEEHSCIYDDGYVQFKTTHLSYYVIGEVAKATTPGGNENPGGDDPKPPVTPSLTYEDGVLQVGVSANYEPYEYLDNGQFKGIEIDILKAIATELGLEIRFENDTFEDLLGNLNAKEVDCIIGVTETAQRNELATATNALFSEDDMEFIIYLNKDCNDLRTAINTAITKLQNNGTIANIIEDYTATEAPDSTTITFNANGGSGVMANQNILFNSDAKLSKCGFIRDGYKFLGWATTFDGAVAYNDEEICSVQTQESITLYAVWEKIVIQGVVGVDFSPNGGSGTQQSLTVPQNSTFTFPECTYTKEGYKFIGWTIYANSNQIHTPGSEGTVGTTPLVNYYAKWEAISYTATFKNGNAIVEEISFTVETTNLVEPSVPAKQCYVGAWSDYEIIADDITIYAEYTLAHSSIEKVDAKEPQCNRTGNIEYWHCSGCDNDYTAQEGTTVATNTTLSTVPCKFENGVCKWCLSDATFSFEKTSNGYLVSGIGDYQGDKLSIPATYNDEPVIGIKYNAFNGNTNIKEIVIAEGILSIQENAFSGCSNLEKVSLPTTLSSIEYEAFENCSNLREIIIPSSCSIGDSVFAGCGSLKKISLGLDQTHTFGYHFGTSEYTDSIAVEQNDITYYIPKRLTEIIITGGNVIDNAFENCTMVISVNIEGTTTKRIGSYSFSNCSSLKTIVMNENVEYIGSAFFFCSSLEKMVLPFVGHEIKTENDTYQSPFGSIFGEVSGNVSGMIKISQWYHQSSLTHTSSSIYTVPSTLKDVTILGGHILFGAFSECNMIETLSLGDGVETINYHGLNCTNIKVLNVSENIKNVSSSFGTILENDQFVFNKYEGGLYIGNEKNPYVIYVKPENKASVTYLIHPDCRIIYHQAFVECDNLEYIEIPSKVHTIEDSAFYCLPALKFIKFDTVKFSVGWGAFCGCNELEHIFYCSTESDWDLIEVDNAYNYNDTILNCAKSFNVKKAVILSSNDGSNKKTYCPISNEFQINLKNYSFDRTGYKIHAWATDANGVNKVEYNYSLPDSTIVFLYAIWATEKYQISYNLDGGLNDARNADEYTIESLITLYEPSKFGYKFDGWYTSSEYSERVNSINVGTTGNISLFAKWIEPTASTGLEYTLNSDGTYSVKSIGECTDSVIVIPSTYNGKSVVSISQYAFRDCAWIVDVILPNGLKTIEWYAFSDCTSLRRIYFPDTVEKIGDGWIYNCYNIEYNEYNNGRYLGNEKNPYIYLSKVIDNSVSSFAISNKTKLVGWGAFSSCKSLSQIDIPDSVVEIGVSAFYGCKNLRQITFGTGIRSIGAQAFLDCTRLTTLDIPDTVNTIGSAVFSSCTGLTELTLPSSLEVIDGCLFELCANLNKVVIPSSVHAINWSAFSQCANLTVIEFNGSVQKWLDIEKGDSWNFNTGDYTIYCSNGIISKSDEVSIFSEGLDFVMNEDGASYSAIGIGSCKDTEVIIPSVYKTLPVTNIANDAFKNASFEKVIIPDSIKSIGEYAFYNCRALQEAIIGNGVKELPRSMFNGCISIKTIVIGSNVNTIGDDVFYNCSNIEKIIIQDLSQWCNMVYSPLYSTMPYSNEYDLYLGESAVTDLVIPSDVLAINKYAFSYCKSIQTVSFHSALESIGNSAFYNCSNLKSISIPKNITAMGYTVFGFCDNLVSVSIEEGIAELSPYLFMNCSKLKELNIPQTVSSIGGSTFSNCTALESIVIPSTVLTMGSHVFDGCTATINCEAAVKPDEWDDQWDYGLKGTIVWFYTGDIWDGTTSYSFAGGTGTEEDPYLISTAEQLAFVAMSVNQGVDTFKDKHLKLTKDIHLMGIEWTPIGNKTYQFEGHFDGDCNKIFGLKSTTNEYYAGFFGYVCYGTIKNLSIIDADLNVHSSVAGILVGYIYNPSQITIERCYVSGKISNYGNGLVVGGIAGQGGKISESVSEATVYGCTTGSSSSSFRYVYAGGIAGQGSAINCYTTGKVTAAGSDLYRDVGYVGGILGSGSVENCYSTATVTGSTNKAGYAGGIVGSSSSVKNSFSTGDVYVYTHYRDEISGRIVAEIEDSSKVENCYADGTQTINGSAYAYCALQFTVTLQSENFIYNTLGWSSDIWQINEGGFPTLK